MSRFYFDRNLPSPLEKITFVKDKRVSIYIKRDDLIHAHVSGNKWRKLKYNFDHISKHGYKGLITFGGAFSNHIFATASAACEYGIPAIGIIRGERDDQNPTLLFAESQGMKLYFVSRSAYKMKEEHEEIQTLIHQYPEYYIIPEGGANTLALAGVKEISREIVTQEPATTHVVTAVGTGTTLAGLIDPNYELIGISVLKHNNLATEIADTFGVDPTDFSIDDDYHFGGYGKWNQALIDFTHAFYNQYNIRLDIVYTAKAMYGLMDKIENDYFPPGSHIVFLHTGGLQGNAGFKYRFPQILHLQ